MSEPKAANPAKLVVGLLVNRKKLVNDVAQDLVREFGKVDLIGPWMDFSYTDYYSKEMGAPLYRRMLVFKKLIEQPDLVSVKLTTNEIENRYAAGGKRSVNIDPGYLLLERFVLATGKNFTHRIYMDRGIYLDLTLIFQKGAYRSLPWTYPDYCDNKMLSFLGQVRQKYTADLQTRS